MSKTKNNTPLNDTIYNIFYVRTLVIKEVTRERFSNLKGPVHVFGKYKVRVIGEMKRPLVQKNLNYLHDLQGQGLSDLFVGAQGLFSLVYSSVNTVKDKLARINKKFVILLSKLMLEVAGFADLVHGKRVDQLINIFLSMYGLVDHFSAQGLETWILAGLTQYLPQCLKDLIKTATLFSNVKLLDDFSLIHELFQKLENFLSYICEKLRVPEKITSFISNCFSYLNLGTKHVILSNLEKFIRKGETNPKLFMKECFREDCKKLDKELDNCLTLQDWSLKAGSVRALVGKWKRFIKIVDSYSETNRVEPNLFVFEGPPGVFKSVFMSKIIQILGWSSYSHIVPSIESGKDFYDSYNNEDVFYMDDVGQEGPSQWRPIMNMHSCIKMPLPCADAQLKDTKFFNSHTIFATTNRFMTLHGLSKMDCIDNIEALWRRGFVFDFSKVARKGNKLTGALSFKYFNQRSREFEVGFPSYFSYKSINPTFNLLESNELAFEEALIWMGSIVKAFKLEKEKMKDSLVWTESQRLILEQRIDDILDFSDAPELQAQGFCSDIKNQFNKMLAGNYIVELLTQEFVDLTSWLSELISGSSISSISEALNFVYVAQGALLCIFCIYLYVNRTGVDTKKVELDLEGQGNIFSKCYTGIHNSVSSVQQNVLECDLVIGDDTKARSNCIVSERLVLLPLHLVPEDNITIRIYQSRECNHIVVDYTKIQKIWSNVEFDVAVCTLPLHFPTPFKSVLHWFKTSSERVDQFKDTFLITGKGFVKVNNTRKLGVVLPYNFRFGTHCNNYRTTEEFLAYDIQALGLCGSPIFNPSIGIVGIHVAGDAKTNTGVASFWPDTVINAIKHLAISQRPLIRVDIPVNEKVLENTSVVKFDTDKYHAVGPNNSNFGPSPLFGIYPVTRGPANLNKYGDKTLKKVATKSFTPCVYIAAKELDFCEKVLESIVEPFGELTDFEVIKGTPSLAGLNKQSSNGFGYMKDKNLYIDFDSGKVTDLFENELIAFKNSIVEGNCQLDKLIWVECLKDEIRNDEKEGVPRSFRIGTLLQQFLMKKYFGRMVENIMAARKFNKIMVGCNPIKEWPWMYERIMTGHAFAGDIKNWDGSMNSQIQNLVAQFFVNRSSSLDKDIITALVSTLTNSIVIIKNELFMTTHSMPSGSYLTAIMNSIVNKLYTAIWYYRNVENPTLEGYWKDVDDFVYGDDKLNVVRSNIKTLNALTMKECFESLNMGFTDSVKREIVTPFQSVSELTFLKRGFEYHNQLQQIVCPLDLRVLYNTLSYVDNSKEDIALVMQDKINAVQREMYLHADRHNLLQNLYFKLSQRNYDFIKLTENYMRSIYLDDNFVLPFGFSTEDKYF